MYPPCKLRRCPVTVEIPRALTNMIGFAGVIVVAVVSAVIVAVAVVVAVVVVALVVDGCWCRWCQWLF